MATAENPDPGNTPSAAAGSPWLKVDEAGRRMGVSEQAVRKACPKWEAAGLAKLERSKGGKLYWLISAAADPALKALRSPVGSPFDAAHLTDAQRAELDKRYGIYRRWRQACKDAMHAPRQISQETATANFLAKLAVERGDREVVTPGTLARWHRRYAKEKLGIQGLIDGRWLLPLKCPTDDRMLLEAKRFYLDASGKSKLECIRAAEQRAIEMGWRVWRETAVRKYLNRLPVGEVTYKREGPEAFKQHCAPFIQRTYRDLKSNEIWQSDHMRFDVLCKVGEKIDPRTGEVMAKYGRPWLTSWIDVRSRKILAFKVRAASPDSGAILEPFSRACREFGVPENVYLDNGADYDCGDFTGETKAQRRKRVAEGRGDETPTGGIYARAGVAHIHAGKFNARAKLVERMHRTIKEGFCHDFDTFTGGNTVEKPERLPEMVAKGVAPTVEEFAAAFAEWVGHYNNKIHQGESMDCTPNEAWNQNLVTKRVAPEAVLRECLERRIGPVKVGRNGVAYKGLYFGQYDTGRLQGEQVYLGIEDDDLSKVAVLDLEGVFICFAQANQVLPAHADRELLAEALKTHRHNAKLLRNAQPARMVMHEDIPATMFRLEQARAERLARSRPENPPPAPMIVPIRPAIEGNAERYQTALERFRPTAPAAEEASLFDAYSTGMELVSEQERQSKFDAMIERLRAGAPKVPSLLEICGVAS